MAHEMWSFKQQQGAKIVVFILLCDEDDEEELKGESDPYGQEVG